MFSWGSQTWTWVDVHRLRPVWPYLTYLIILHEYKFIVCDPLNENPALPTNTEFKLETILSVKGIFQLNSDYCTKVITGGLHCIILNYEALLCYYKDAISLNSHGQLKHAFSNKGNFTSFQSVYSCLSIYRQCKPPLSPRLSFQLCRLSSCLFTRTKVDRT